MKFLTHDGLLYFWQKIKSMIGNTSNLSTGTNIVDAVNQCFQNVSNGKELVASTLTDKGITTSSDATFQDMANNIGRLTNVSDNTANIAIADHGYLIYGTIDPSTTAIPSNVPIDKWLVCLIKNGYYKAWLHGDKEWAEMWMSASKVAEAIGLYSNKLLETDTVCGVQGSIPNRQLVDPNIGGINDDYTTVAIHDGTYPQLSTATVDGITRLAMCPPEGWYSGNGYAYVGVKLPDVANALGITSNKIVGGNTICGITGTGGSKMNIYTQMNEPTEKEGIWIQDGNGYNSVITDGSYYTNGNWLPIVTGGNIPPIGCNTGAVTIGNSCYFIGLYGLYKYTPSTDTYQTVCSFSTNDGVSNGSAICAVGTNIYIFGGYYQESQKSNAYKIDTLNNSKTSIQYVSYIHNNGNSYGYGIYNGCGAVSLGTDIYIMGSYVTSVDSQKFFKYNTLTNTYSTINSPPTLTVDGCSCVVGTDIYIFSESCVYKYDTINCNYTSLQGLPFTPNSNLKCISVGNEIYIIGGTKLYKYITNTNSYVYISDTPMHPSYSSYQMHLGKGGVALCQSKLLFFGDNNLWGESRSEYTLIDKQYNNGTIVILRSDETQGTYKTQFFTSKINTQFGRITSGFNDAAFYYNNALHNNLPTYYGNGHSWIQFK